MHEPFVSGDIYFKIITNNLQSQVPNTEFQPPITGSLNQVKQPQG